jgi:hypothetical protein
MHPVRLQEISMARLNRGGLFAFNHFSQKVENLKTTFILGLFKCAALQWWLWLAVLLVWAMKQMAYLSVIQPARPEWWDLLFLRRLT